jgi:cytochrome P450
VRVSGVIAPGRLPWVGHAAAVARHPLRFFEQLQGRGGMVGVSFGPLSTVFLTEPELVHQMLMDRGGVLDKGRFYDKVRPLAGNGIVLANGEDHRRQLAVVKPAFHHRHLAAHTTVMRDVAATATGAWQPGRPIAVDKQMHAITLRILARTMFGAGVDDHAVAELIRLLPGVLRGIMTRTVTPDALLRLPLPANRRFDRAFADLRAAISRIMRAHRGSATDGGDLLSMILATRDPRTGRPPTERDVCDQIVAVTMAGSETAATSMAWTFYEIARHPQVEARLVAEIGAVLGDRPVEAADAGRLPYTRQVLQESLRLHQPILVISRRTTGELDLSGVRVPAGTELFYSPYGLFRDAGLYPRPHDFDPGRWQTRPVSALPRGAFLPFGGGPRHCLGEHFAWLMMTVVVVEVLRRWRLRLPRGFQARAMPWATINPRSLPMTAYAAPAPTLEDAR